MPTFAYAPGLPPLAGSGLAAGSAQGVAGGGVGTLGLRRRAISAITIATAATARAISKSVLNVEFRTYDGLVDEEVYVVATLASAPETVPEPDEPLAASV